MKKTDRSALKGIFIAGLVLVLGILTVYTVNAGERVTGPDTDGDSIPDYRVCVVEDDGLFCEDRLDNCINVPNDMQLVSLKSDEKNPLGTACDYDFTGPGGGPDGVVDTIDYGWLVQKNIDAFINGLLPCDIYNCIGDLDNDGFVTYLDQCEFVKRHPDLNIAWPPSCPIN